ncbi:MAG: phage Gp37/Gp68 family protein [Chloroflexi bacterium]|nr:phage Gp37/Gp68 family protein [Chloroflexota bacterium]
MAQSSIEWTESTWNPLTGCTKISPGCKFCYAERMSKRLQSMGQPRYAAGFKLTLHEDILELPLSWRKPQLIFTNSMSDLFHKHIPALFIYKAFDVMRRASWHQFQLLTKRSGRLLEMSPAINWPDNVWMGVSVEQQDYVFRIDDLRETGAAIKFVSFEPLLGPLPKLDLREIDWVIVGGESGPRARPMQEDWVLEIKAQCQRARMPFFFKQWGGFNKKKAGRLLEGRTWDELPKVPLQEALAP